MILVDTSIWIDLFNNPRLKHPTNEKMKTFAVCPPVIQEIVQGISDPSQQGRMIHSILGFHCVGSPVKLEDYLLAADIFSTGRRKGLTIRSSVDCLIAAIAIQHKLPVLHKDRDFDLIARFTALQIAH